MTSRSDKTHRPARERIRAELERWFLVEPLLFGAWSTHRVAPSARCETMRVAAGTIEYDPDFVASLDDAELGALMQLEALRIVLRHPYERRKPNPVIAYQASNLALQEHLRTRFLPSAREVFGTDAHDRQSFEIYHRLLSRESASSRSEGKDSDGGASRGASGPGGAGTSSEGPPGPGSGAPGESAEGARPEAEAGGSDASSSASGCGAAGLDMHANAERVGATNALGWDLDDGLSEAIEREIKNAAANQSWGRVGGRARTEILATLRPQLRYQDVLRHMRASLPSTEVQLTRMRPSRRYGFAQLGRRYAMQAKLLVAIDVSGSMSDADIGVGFSIVHRFFAHRVPEIDVLTFDTEVRGPVQTLRKARRSYEVIGRGGTSFQPVMDYLDAHPGYDGLLIYTDGIAPPPTRPKNRGTRVVWLFSQERSWRVMAERLGLPRSGLGRACFVRSAPRGV